MQSPRRSPRISAESPRRQSPRILEKQSVNTERGAAAGTRRSTGGLKGGKNNDAHHSPSDSKIKIGRRAHSMGGDRSLKGLQPGPRKSAIRALPPQVFESPTSSTEDLKAHIKSATASASNVISAFGGAELMELMKSVGSLGRAKEPSVEPPHHQSRKSAPGNVHNDGKLELVGQAENDNTLARKKRRVTFNPYQEKNAFDLEEPTIRVRPSGEAELLVETNSTSSNDDSSVDMSLDSSDDSGIQSEEEAQEASMEITAEYIEGPSQDKEESLDDDSAMDMTTAYGGMVNNTTAMLPSGEEDDSDNDSDSELESESEQSEGMRGEDRTVTMQFTAVHGADESDSGMQEETEDEDEVVAEEEDEEVDMQLTEINGDSRAEEKEGEGEEEEDSGMELTGIYQDSPSEAASPEMKRARLSSASSRRRPSNAAISTPDRTTDSNRRGHEYCHIPAADSPKPRLSAATIKAQTQRQSMSRSPVKPLAPSPKKSLQSSSTTSTSVPFRSSSSPSKSSTTTTLKSRQSVPAAPTTPTRSSPFRSRQSSPLRSPSTPSRAWKSFQSEARSWQGTAESPPPRRLSLAPSNSIKGTPQRIPVGAMDVRSSPFRSDVVLQAEVATNLTEQWTMKEFFDALDLGFMELSAPSKRKVTRDDRLSEGKRQKTVELSKAACVHAPFVENMVRACEELKRTVDEDREWISNYEESFHHRPPLYVEEVTSMASMEERQEAMSQFKIQKSAARAKALKESYDWRTAKQYNEGTLSQWETVRSKIETDVQYLKEKAKVVRGEALPILQRRHLELVEEVEKERKRQAAIESTDDEEMQGLYNAMAEQSVALKGQEEELHKAESGLVTIQEQLSDVAAKREAANTITHEAHALSEEYLNCTEEEANRLARHVKHIERLHLWTLDRASLWEIVMNLEEEVSLTIQLDKIGVSSAHVEVYKGTIWQEALQKALVDHLDSLDGHAEPADLVRFTTIAWSRIRHLSSLYDGLLARFPAEIHMYEEEANGRRGALLRAIVLLPRRKSKVVVEVRCEMSRILDCDAPLFEQEDISAHYIYGSGIDAPAIAVQIADIVMQGKNAGNLTEAILEAQQTHD